jgi:hypothetical protein
MLRELVMRWDNHKIMVRWLSRFFKYLEWDFIARRSLPTLSEVGLMCFHDLVCSSQAYQGWLLTMVWLSPLALCSCVVSKYQPLFQFWSKCFVFGIRMRLAGKLFFLGPGWNEDKGIELVLASQVYLLSAISSQLYMHCRAVCPSVIYIWWCLHMAGCCDPGQCRCMQKWKPMWKMP